MEVNGFEIGGLVIWSKGCLVKMRKIGAFLFVLLFFAIGMSVEINNFFFEKRVNKLLFPTGREQ